MFVDASQLDGYAVEHDGRPVGCALLHVVDNHAELVVLATNYRGAGAGTSLLEAVGTVTVRHDGKIVVTIGSAREVLDPPRGKDIDDQMVEDLRRILSGAGYHSS